LRQETTIQQLRQEIQWLSHGCQDNDYCWLPVHQTLADRARDMILSLEVHRSRCIEKGKNFHHARDASAGHGAAEQRLHQRANQAKHGDFLERHEYFDPFDPFKLLSGMCETTTEDRANGAVVSSAGFMPAFAGRSLHEQARAQREKTQKHVSIVKRVVQDTLRAASLGFDLVEGCSFPEVGALLDREWGGICSIIHKHGFVPRSAEAPWHHHRTQCMVRYAGFGDRQQHLALQSSIEGILKSAAEEIGIPRFCIFVVQENT